MIIAITKAGRAELREPDDFKNFKILVEAAGAQPDFIAGALKGIATMEPDGKTAWVSQAALKNWQGKPQPADWVAAFDKMIASVKRFGWVRDEDATVRAHLESVG
jgi:hypothetical protein